MIDTIIICILWLPAIAIGFYNLGYVNGRKSR